MNTAAIGISTGIEHNAIIKSIGDKRNINVAGMSTGSSRRTTTYAIPSGHNGIPIPDKTTDIKLKHPNNQIDTPIYFGSTSSSLKLSYIAGIQSEKARYR